MFKFYKRVSLDLYSKLNDVELNISNESFIPKLNSVIEELLRIVFFKSTIRLLSDNDGIIRENKNPSLPDLLNNKDFIFLLVNQEILTKKDIKRCLEINTISNSLNSNLFILGGHKSNYIDDIIKIKAIETLFNLCVGTHRFILQINPVIKFNKKYVKQLLLINKPIELKSIIDETQAVAEAPEVEEASVVEETKENSVDKEEDNSEVVVVDSSNKNIAKKSNKKKIIIASCLSTVALFAIILVLSFTLFVPMSKYNKALELANDGKYYEAYEILEKTNYSDSKNKKEIVNYVNNMNSNNYKSKLESLLHLGCKITVNYDANGGVIEKKQEVIVDSKDFYLQYPYYNSYNFVEWNIKNYSLDLKENNVIVNFIASWEPVKYYIYYNLDGGTFAYNPNYFTENNTPIYINNPKKEGYEFIGWNDGYSLYNMNYIIDSSIKHDVYLYAEYVPKNYTIYFSNTGDNYFVAPIQVTFDQYVELPIPTREGFIFEGWYYNEELFDSDIYRIPNNITLEARWTKCLVISFNSMGGSYCDNIYSAYNQEISYLPTPTMDGMVFVGWYYSKPNNIIKTPYICPFKTDVTLYASYIQPFDYYVNENNNAVIRSCNIDIEYIDIPSNIDGYMIEEISSNAFSNKTKLKTITIPEGVQTIRENAFSNCLSLEQINLPSTLTNIGADAFVNSCELKNVYYNGTLENWCSIIFGSVYSNPAVYQAHIYMMQNGVSSEIVNLKFTSKVTEIHDYAFYGFVYVTRVTFSGNIKRIGDYAFASCTGINNMRLPTYLTEIGNYAFYNCTSLTNVTFKNNLASILSYAFANCINLTEIIIPASVTYIGEYVFTDPASLVIYCEATSLNSNWNSLWNFGSLGYITYYLYSEKEPVFVGNYWHYVNQKPVIW